MRALGNYILGGRLQAAAVIGTLTVLSWFLPPLAYLMSGVPVGLVALRRGALVGLQVAAGSFLFIAAIALIAGVDTGIAAGFALGIWVPVWLGSLVLRQTRSQGLMVVAAGGIGVFFVVAMHLAVEDVPGWWRTWFESWLETNLPPDAVAQYQSVVDAAVPLLNAMMGSALVVSLTVTLLIARWWQALLFNPGGFRREFFLLRLPRFLALPTLLGVVLVMTGEGALQAMIRDVLVVMLFMYLFQGIAAVHRTVAGYSLSGAWLVAMYGLLLLIPHMALFMACLGLVDSWAGRSPTAGDSGSGGGKN